MAIDKTTAAAAGNAKVKALESLDSGKARLAGAVASAVSLAATVGMSVWMIRLLAVVTAGRRSQRNLYSTPLANTIRKAFSILPAAAR